MLEIVANVKIPEKFKTVEDGKERYDMCKAFEDMRQEGYEEGIEEGEARINTLYSILINLNRFDDLKRAVTDKDFQMQLMLELLPEESQHAEKH